MTVTTASSHPLGAQSHDGSTLILTLIGFNPQSEVFLILSDDEACLQPVSIFFHIDSPCGDDSKKIVPSGILRLYLVS